MKNDLQDNMKTRSPIVVVMGHVDHGKTSLLDYIRQTRVCDKECGGITQHIGAYQVVFQDRPITFLDTPGHEAFSAMRSRGAKVADIALLIVAADEGLKAQTIEAINHIKNIELPVIVVINKMDKLGALPEKVKKELARQNVLVESLGGGVPVVLTSAKTGQGVDELLEMILLMAEMEEISQDISGLGQGVVIESHLDAQRGVTTTLLLLVGKLGKNNLILTESTHGSAKILEDFKGQAIEKAIAGMPILVCGLKEVPSLGEQFEVVTDEAIMEEKVKAHSAIRQQNRLANTEVISSEGEEKPLNLILKTDVVGSIEAIKEMISSIPQEKVKIHFLLAEAGDIIESDIKLAMSAGAKIIGFNSKIKSSLEELAKHQKVTVINFEVIYELVQAVRDLASKKLSPETIREDLGKLKIVAVFMTKPPRMIVGGKVIEGKLMRPAQIEVWRDSQKIGQGRLIELQRDKKEADEVSKNQEAGIMFEGNTTIETGDILVFYREKKQKKEL